MKQHTATPFLPDKQEYMSQLLVLSLAMNSFLITTGYSLMIDDVISFSVIFGSFAEG